MLDSPALLSMSEISSGGSAGVLTGAGTVSWSAQMASSSIASAAKQRRLVFKKDDGCLY